MRRVKTYIHLAGWLLAAGCSGEALKKEQLDVVSPKEFQNNYVRMVERVQATTKKTDVQKIPAYLETCLRDSMFEYWYGTRWGFYGTTPKPRQGKIACGYFVTTTLKHLGLNIN